MQSPKKAKPVDAPAAEAPLVVPVQPHASVGAHVQGLPAYQKLQREAMADPRKFWAKQARSVLTWDRDFSSTTTGSFEHGDLTWFSGGKLNASVQCLDRHVWNPATADCTALIWEADEIGEGRKYTFREALRAVCRIANVMKAQGVRKGDAVTLYMPMVPESVFVMLACARLGAPHSVVFAGFSAEALRDRIVDVQSRFVFVCDEGMRGGRSIALKRTVDEALADARCAFVQRVFMFKRTGAAVGFNPARDLWMEPLVAAAAPFCPAESVDAEDTLFFLYTSGSTGKPKGIVHTTAGYLLFAAYTHKLVFDVRPDDVYACVADVGWITGHTYIVYGPLANGVSTLVFESTPMHPNVSRYWDLVQRHRITQLYTAPTAIRALMKSGNEPLEGYDLSSLRILGSVGEPIGPTPWMWYFTNVGKGRCAVVDTFWQTETGGIMASPLPGATPMKPGSCCLPLPGIDLVLLDPQTGSEVLPVPGQSTSGLLCMRHPWPGISRTVRGDHPRYLSTYMGYAGYYFTGDGATRDADGYFWITGRVDDVLNVSGHRLGSAELEAAINAHAGVAESAVMGFPHEIKGEGIAVFVILKQGVAETPELVQALRAQVRQSVGAFAVPDHIIITPGLPKTRSGKIMRRILRKILAKESDQLGDISTLAEPGVVDVLVEKVTQALKL